jgi:hypothetical protein
MPRLGLLGLIMGLLLAAEMQLVSVYVPGHIQDGVYIRPHFRPTGQTPLEIEKGVSERMPAKPAVLDAKPPPTKPLSDTPS